MFAKKLIPCLYLCKEKAVYGFHDRAHVLASDPVSLAASYFQNGADAILVFDLSEGDNEHERALDILKEICFSVEIPVIGAGNVKRMEDIKKLLYAGCKMAALNFSKEHSPDLAKEVSQKFGKEKIAVCISDPGQYEKNAAIIHEWASSVISIKEAVFTQPVKESKLPVICVCDDPCIEKIVSLAKASSLSGISGLYYDNGCLNLIPLKRSMEENGIPVSKMEAHFSWKDLKKNSDGMVPVVV
ncbi:MAG: bifunctional phosphoribosyl-AMP cyclohydrolase/phosphoribosyl-ATP pyrophosphatase, partial [Lachnospiraceae bacterium]|nr:bifunctional phosphoribosyl-AMP cyclohydrolase/phosphoribosyl-ATP pyrophosphatase [Lachnospiraceae bacterium]